jgi:hypothetical protein
MDGSQVAYPPSIQHRKPDLRRSGGIFTGTLWVQTIVSVRIFRGFDLGKAESKQKETVQLPHLSVGIREERQAEGETSDFGEPW